MPVAYYVDPSEASLLAIKWWARRDSNPQALFRQRILSPPRIPIPPLAQNLQLLIVATWRHLPELNRCKRFCRPLRNHSAKVPYPHCNNLLTSLAYALQNCFAAIFCSRTKLCSLGQARNTYSQDLGRTPAA